MLQTLDWASYPVSVSSTFANRCTYTLITQLLAAAAAAVAAAVVVAAAAVVDAAAATPLQILLSFPYLCPSIAS